jgi:phenylacetate-CoA ligase
MHRFMLSAFHSLPGPVRSAAATLHGLRLRWWRYGPETETLVREALERETWSADRWEAWRSERLRLLLRRAATRVPHYRRLWAGRPGGAPEALSEWPILEKEGLRSAPLEFLADGCRPGRMYHDHTSGTTGTSVNLWLSRGAVRAWYALAEARWRRWYGVSRRDRWAILGGQLVAPVSRRRPPFWVWNGALNQLYMSAYHLAPDLVPAYLEALRAYRVRYLLGYTSSLHVLAQEVLRQGRDDLRMAVVITNAEPLLGHERAAMSEAFGCPVRETYGMTEMVTAASECEAGVLHLWPEVGYTEVLEGSRSVPAGSPGDIVATGLLNPDMPLVRYRVGDRVVLAEGNDACPCGRTLPVLQSVEGRGDDVLVTPDGRRVGRLDPVFKGDLALWEAQIVQEAPDRLRVRYVPAPGFSEESANTLTRRLRDRMGPVAVVLEEVPSIERGANGKFRAVVSLLRGAAAPMRPESGEGAVAFRQRGNRRSS